jgi:hypothetical protein
MNCFAASLAIACAAAMFATTANAETVEDLKHELAAKKAYIAKLKPIPVKVARSLHA